MRVVEVLRVLRTVEVLRALDDSGVLNCLIVYALGEDGGGEWEVNEGESGEGLGGRGLLRARSCLGLLNRLKLGAIWSCLIVRGATVQLWTVDRLETVQLKVVTSYRRSKDEKRCHHSFGIQAKTAPHEFPDKNEPNSQTAVLE